MLTKGQCNPLINNDKLKSKILEQLVNSKYTKF